MRSLKKRIAVMLEIEVVYGLPDKQVLKKNECAKWLHGA